MTAMSWLALFPLGAFSFLLSALGELGAQTSAGTIRGVVTDTAGSPIQGATLRISGTETRRISDPRGLFAFDQVQPGRYRLTATMIGAEPKFDTVVVRAGDTAHVRFTLRVIPFKPETLPPRFARGTRPDTSAGNTEHHDLISRVGGFPILRGRRPPDGRRELRLWYGGGYGIPENMVRLWSDGARVRGQTIRHLEHFVPDRASDPRTRAMMDSVPIWLRSTFGCESVSTDTLHHPGAQEGYRVHLVAVCVSRYRREPDWAGLLRDLEAQDVWTLPDASELPSIGNIVSIHGPSVTVEAWNGRRYRAYRYGAPHLIPAPEARNAGAIQHIVLEFLKRTHGDLQTVSR